MSINTSTLKIRDYEKPLHSTIQDYSQPSIPTSVQSNHEANSSAEIGFEQVIDSTKYEMIEPSNIRGQQSILNITAPNAIQINQDLNASIKNLRLDSSEHAHSSKSKKKRKSKYMPVVRKPPILA